MFGSLDFSPTSPVVHLAFRLVLRNVEKIVVQPRFKIRRLLDVFGANEAYSKGAIEQRRERTMKTVTNTTRPDRLPEQTVSVYVSNPFDYDPSDEMPGDLNTGLEIDLDTVDLDYANLYFVS